jgi:MFS family permease
MQSRKPQVLMYFVNAFFWMTVYVYVPQFSHYLGNDMGLKASFIGVVTGSYGLTQMLLRLPLGIWSDRLRRRKPFILAGIAVGGLSSLLMFLFTTSPVMMLIGRLMAGLAACAYVQISILFSSYFNGSQHSMGFVEGSTAAGQLVAMILGGIVAGAIGYRWDFLAAALLSIVGIVLASFASESRKERKPASLRDIGSVLSERTLVVAAVLAVFTQAINFGKGYVFTQTYAGMFHATQMDLSLITVSFQLPIALFAPLTATLLAPRVGARRLVAVGFALQAVSCAMMPFAQGLGMVYASQFVTGLGYAMIFPSLMALCVSKMPDEKRATAMGFYQAVYGLGIFAGPWLTGVLIDALGSHQAFYVNAGLALLAAAGAVIFISAKAGKKVTV